MRPFRSACRVFFVGTLLASVAVSCSDSSDDEGTPADTVTTTMADTVTTTEAAGRLLVMVTNDDGVGAPGIDALVAALRARDDVEVLVVAPAENQSGTGSKVTDGPLTVAAATTASGVEATSVAGFPADTVVWAVDQQGVDREIGLVISGINTGQNVGVLSKLSGTVGAAKAAAARGIPSVAVSQGLGDPPDFPSGVGVIMDWLDQHLADLGAADGDPNSVVAVSLNIPTCPAGVLRGVVRVPTAPAADPRGAAPPDCTSTSATPVDDVDAYANGFASESVIPADG